MNNFGKDMKVPNKDIIYRQAAIDACLRGKVDGLPATNVACDCCAERIRVIPSAQPKTIQNNAVHLCDSCQYTYVTCPSHDNDAVFGDGKGNDNICACNKYRPISAQPDIAEKLYQSKCYITDVKGLQHEVIHTGDIRRVTGWEI